jgi:late competence protein required for DNA uptake (superfamily II DNA/RNA helicase)
LGCEFKAAPNELVIVDEADTFMFSNSRSFAAMIEECCCICFTATPDNCDVKGIEAKVVNGLKFPKYSYVLEQDQ